MRNGQYPFIMSTKGSDVVLRGIIIQKKICIFYLCQKRFQSSKSYVATTDYGRTVRKSPSLQGRKSTPTPKFLGTAEAYFVCHILQNFQISLIYAFIGCPQYIFETIEVQINFRKFLAPLLPASGFVFFKSTFCMVNEILRTINVHQNSLKVGQFILLKYIMIYSSSVYLFQCMHLSRLTM